MTDQLPEVAWLVVEPEWQDGDGNPLVGGEWEGHDFTGKGTLFLRADTAIPRAEADAMVAAALEKAAEKCAIIDHTPGEDETEFDKGYDQACAENALIVRSSIPADALAAFEQAVQKAVEAERERIERRVIQACSEISPGDDACIIEDAMLAAIRDPQETSE